MSLDTIQSDEVGHERARFPVLLLSKMNNGIFMRSTSEAHLSLDCLPDTTTVKRKEAVLDRMRKNTG